MAKEKDVSISGDGTHAIEKFQFGDAIMMFIIVVLCITCVFPLIHVLAKSLSADSYVAAQKVTFLPKGLTLDAYKSILKDSSMVYAMLYSAGLTLLFAVLGVTVSMLAAYPLSHKQLPFRRPITFILMFTMYFGAGLIPTYLHYNSLNLLDTFWVLLLPGLFSAYNMLIMKSYLSSSIPASLEESAFIDGASYAQILFKIIIPLSKPIIATLLLYYAVGRWNSYGDNLYYIKMKPELRTLQYKLYLMVSTAAEAQTTALSEAAEVQSSPEVLQSAAVMFTTLPILCVYPFVQKYFVKGIMIGSVKG